MISRLPPLALASMQQFSASPRELIASFWRNRELTLALTQREILGRYRGSALGILWSFVHPLFMLAVYTFVFSVVFKARWGSGSNSKAEFALVLFAGLILFNLFAECITRSPSLILENANYVKRVVFPLEVLPWVSMGAALFHAMISLVVWLVFYLALLGAPKLTALRGFLKRATPNIICRQEEAKVLKSDNIILLNRHGLMPYLTFQITPERISRLLLF